MKLEEYVLQNNSKANTFLFSVCSQYKTILCNWTKWKFEITSNVFRTRLENFEGSSNKIGQKMKLHYAFVTVHEKDAQMCAFLQLTKKSKWTKTYLSLLFLMKIVTWREKEKKYLMRWSNKFATFCFWMETVGASHFSLFFFFHHICEGEEEGLTQTGVRILAKRSVLFPSLKHHFSSWNGSF